MMRGINRQTIFEDDEDKLRFLSTLEKYKSIGNHKIYSYCKRISSSYVYWYNMKYERSGHLFQGRFKSEIVEDEAYFLTVLRYIHQNPVKAGIAVNVFEYEWSSFHEYFGKGKLVDIDFALCLFSKDKEISIPLYLEYMQQANDDECLDIEVTKRISDQEVREYLTQLGISNTSVLQQMDKPDRDVILAKLKELEGVSIRQLSRITGISRSVIGRAGGTVPSSRTIMR